jgi:hypothetical protein
VVGNRIKYITGLDLGHVTECTALAVLEQTTGPDPDAPGRNVKRYAVRHLERFALGTPFTAVCTRLHALFSAPPLEDSLLTVDQTAVGRPVVNLVRRARLVGAGASQLSGEANLGRERYPGSLAGRRARRSGTGRCHSRLAERAAPGAVYLVLKHS